MDTSTWSVVDAGLDALNLTTNSREGRSLFVDLFTAHSAQSEQEGWLLTDGKKGNYQTLQINSWMLGTDPNRGSWLSVMGKSVSTLPLSRLHSVSKCTRCDLQTTWTLTTKFGGLATSTYRKLSAEQQSTLSGPSLALTMSNTGSTLYYGKRSNGFLGRLYDKGGQTGLADVGWLWRLEWEYRKHQAESIWSALHEWDFDRSRIRDWVLQEGHKRGIPVPQNTAAVEADVDWGNSDPDVQRKLQWLATQVKPTIDFLIDKGYSQSVRDILGGGI